MKNALLTISAALLTCSGMMAATAAPRISHSDLFQCSGPKPAPAMEQTSTRAAGSVDFSWANEVYTAYGFNNVPVGANVYQAFQVDPNVVSLMAGKKISAISVTTGVNEKYNKNPDANITLFLTTDLGEEPFYTMDFKRSYVAFNTESIPLAEPQEFDAAKPLYVGYYFTTNKLSQYYIPVDGKPISAPASYIAIMTDADTKPTSNSWANYADQMGALCMGCTFTGDNMADLIVTPIGLSCPSISAINQAPSYTVSVLNLGSVKVESMDIHVEATGEQPYDINYIPVSEIVAGTPVSISIPGNQYTVTGEKEIKISITKINGKDNPAANSAATTKTIVIEHLYPRVGLFEIGTGTWCGWCPRSLVALEYIHDSYEGKIIGIAYHNGDAMANAYSNIWVGYANPPGFPYALFNRVQEGAEPFNNSYADLDAQFNECIATGSLCQAEVGDLSLDENGRTGTITAKYRFVENVSSDNYLVSIVLLEDNVGPYKQTNNYPTGNAGPLFGWEKESTSVPYTYNDVCRFISGCPGSAITPETTTLNKGQDYTVEFKISLAQIKSTDEDPAFRAVAIISDKETGEVLNADVKNFRKSSDVQGIMSDVAAPQIVLGEGSISISNANSAAIYTLDGVKVADGSASGLAKGIYVVKADNMVQKVMVK